MSDDTRSPASFGPNVWLVDEMYEQYRSDPASVGPSWQEFFANYRQSPAPPRSAAAHVAEPSAPASDETGNGVSGRTGSGNGAPVTSTAPSPAPAGGPVRETTGRETTVGGAPDGAAPPVTSAASGPPPGGRPRSRNHRSGNHSRRRPGRRRAAGDVRPDGSESGPRGR